MVLLADAPLTLREFITQEPLPLATIFHEVLSLLITREDAVVFGAHAVNAYCEPPRMTADIDVMSTDARGLAEDLRGLLADRLRIAVRVGEVREGAFWIYQLRKPKNRHWLDVRQVAQLPPFRTMGKLRVIEPTELAVLKAMAIAARSGHEKALSDRLDLHRLLRTFPELRADDGPVRRRLQELGAGAAALAAWSAVARDPLDGEDDDDSEDDRRG